MNREKWLSDLTAALRPAFESAGKPLPAEVKLSCGFPSKGAKSKTIGECHYADAPQIFIRPDQHEPMEVAAIVLHELCHAALGPGFGHGKEFKKLATGLGLTGKMKSTVAGDAAKALLEPLAAALGPYPHTPLNCRPAGRAVAAAGKRQMNVNCPDCGFHAKVLAEQSWMGRLRCPADGEELLTKAEIEGQ